MWNEDCLYHIGQDLAIKLCVREDEMQGILKSFHNQPYGGHFTNKITAYKVLQSRYY